MSHSSSSSGGYPGVVRKVMDNYAALISLNATTLLAGLYVNDVITIEEKEIITKTIPLERHKMQYLLDHIIIPSLQEGKLEKYQDFLRVMEESDDIPTSAIARRLVLMEQQGGVVEKSTGHGGTSSSSSEPGAYDSIVKRVMDNYKSLTALDPSFILVNLYCNGVITLEQKEVIATKQLRSNKMQYILDSIIIPSLQAGRIEQFKNFLLSMEESDDPVTRNIGQRLGRSTDFP